MAQCWWGAEKMQMEVELWGSGAATATQAGIQPAAKRSSAGLGWHVSGREAQVQTLVFNFLKIKVKVSCCLLAAKLRAFSSPAEGYSCIPTNPGPIPRKTVNEMPILSLHVFTHLSIVKETVYVIETYSSRIDCTQYGQALATVCICYVICKLTTLAFSGRRYWGSERERDLPNFIKVFCRLRI